MTETTLERMEKVRSPLFKEREGILIRSKANLRNRKLNVGTRCTGKRCVGTTWASNENRGKSFADSLRNRVNGTCTEQRTTMAKEPTGD